MLRVFKLLVLGFREGLLRIYGREVGLEVKVARASQGVPCLTSENGVGPKPLLNPETLNPKP